MHLIAVPRVCKGLSGGDKVILFLSQYIDKSRFSVVIAGLKDSPIANSYLIQEANRVSIPADIIDMSNRFDLRAIFTLRQLLKKYQINILHCHGYKADLVGFFGTRFSDIKLVSTIHGWIGVDLKVKIYDLIDLMILRFFTKVIPVAGTFKNRLLRWGIPKKKVIVIHNCIDTNWIEQRSSTINIKSEFNTPDKARIVSTIGRLSKEKGHKYFLDAAVEVNKDYSNVIFFIIGEGPLKAELIKYAEKIGIGDKVKFTGFRQDAINFLRLTDIFVLPSITEGFPISILEAMALGKPVVTTDVGDIPLLIKNGETGILVSSKDVKGLSDAVKTLLSDKEMVAKMGREAKDLVKCNFSVGSMVKKYETIYDRVVNEKNKDFNCN